MSSSADATSCNTNRQHHQRLNMLIGNSLLTLMNNQKNIFHRNITTTYCESAQTPIKTRKNTAVAENSNSCSDCTDSSKKKENNSSRSGWWSLSILNQWLYLPLSWINNNSSKNSLHAIQATLPRPLVPNDIALNWPELQTGLKMRAKDEQRLLALQETAMRARAAQQQAMMIQVANEMAEIIYGKGMTAKLRQEHLIRYGCAAWTDDAVQYLQELGFSRGFVEIGAGNGQWARRLSSGAFDVHDDNTSTSLSSSQRSRRSRQDEDFEYVMAYDDYSSLPMNPHIYAYPVGDLRDEVEASFYPHVRRGSHVDAFKDASNEGRILLMVYPPPGPMAIETVRAYMVQSAQNDTLVYVGEGRGGANADNAFFDFLEGCTVEVEENTSSPRTVWVLQHLLDLAPFGHDKGFERMFVFRRTVQNASDGN